MLLTKLGDRHDVEAFEIPVDYSYNKFFARNIPMTIDLNKIGELGKSQNSLPDQTNYSVSLIINLPDKALLSGSESYRLVISRACLLLCYLYAKIVCPSIFSSQFSYKME